MLCCPLCRLQYDDARRLPMLGLCGHTICAICRSNLVRRQCPVSLRCSLVKYSFLFPAVNYTVQEHVDMFKRMKRKMDDFKQAFPLRNFTELRQSLIDSHRDEALENSVLIQALSDKISELKSQLEMLERGNHDELNSREMDVVQCSKCKESMADWLAMCCVNCMDGIEVSNSGVVITDLKKLRKNQLCGNCILESEHKHHPFDTIIAFQARHLIQEKLKDQLETVKSLKWPNDDSGAIHYHNLKRLITDSTYCRSLKQVNDIIRNVQNGVSSVLQMHRKAWDNAKTINQNLSFSKELRNHRKRISAGRSNTRSRPIVFGTPEGAHLSRRSNRLRTFAAAH